MAKIASTRQVEEYNQDIMSETQSSTAMKSRVKQSQKWLKEKLRRDVPETIRPTISRPMDFRREEVVFVNDESGNPVMIKRRSGTLPPHLMHLNAI